MYWVIDKTGRYIRVDIRDVARDVIARAHQQMSDAREHIAVSEALVAHARRLRHERHAERAWSLRPHGVH